MIIVGLITTVITLLLPNHYKATTTFYAANPSLANPNGLGYEESPRYVFGTNDDTDRLFSIITSGEIKAYLIKKFDLYKVYKIDSTTLKGKHTMNLAFEENYKAISTKYKAIELSVEDTDPKRAADIANSAREYANDVTQRLIKDSQLKSLQSTKENLELQEKRVTLLGDSIRLMKAKSKMIDPYFQSEAYSQEAIKTEALLAESKGKANYYSKYESKKDSVIKYNALAAGYQNKLNQIRTSLSTFYEVGPWLKKKEQEYSRAGDQLSVEKEKEKLLAAAYNSSFTGLHVIDQAYPPLVKSRPKRSLIILGAMLITLLASVMGLLMIKSIKRA